jgi:hypothetical protein
MDLSFYTFSLSALAINFVKYYSKCLANIFTCFIGKYYFDSLSITRKESLFTKDSIYFVFMYCYKLKLDYFIYHL